MPSTRQHFDLDARDKRLGEELHRRAVSYLIVTVADPVDSLDGYRFDLQLDTLHKALGTNVYDPWVMAGSYLPWQTFQDRASLEPQFAVDPGERCTGTSRACCCTAARSFWACRKMPESINQSF